MTDIMNKEKLSIAVAEYMDKFEDDQQFVVRDSILFVSGDTDKLIIIPAGEKKLCKSK